MLTSCCHLPIDRDRDAPIPITALDGSNPQKPADPAGGRRAEPPRRLSSRPSPWAVRSALRAFGARSVWNPPAPRHRRPDHRRATARAQRLGAPGVRGALRTLDYASAADRVSDAGTRGSGHQNRANLSTSAQALPDRPTRDRHRGGTAISARRFPRSAECPAAGPPGPAACNRTAKHRAGDPNPLEWNAALQLRCTGLGSRQRIDPSSRVRPHVVLPGCCRLPADLGLRWPLSGKCSGDRKRNSDRLLSPPRLVHSPRPRPRKTHHAPDRTIHAAASPKHYTG
jgi:hypothetical protein